MAYKINVNKHLNLEVWTCSNKRLNVDISHCKRTVLYMTIWIGFLLVLLVKSIFIHLWMPLRWMGMLMVGFF